MKEAVARKWVEALRSGRYRQGTQALRFTENIGKNGKDRLSYRYCCLGVLCDLARKDGIERSLPHELVTCTLPEAVKRWAGIDHQSCKFLAKLNDDNPESYQGKGFPAIADYIEGNSKDL